MTEDKSYFVDLEHKINWHQYRAKTGESESHRSKTMRVPRENCDALSLTDTSRRKTGGQAITERVEI